MSNLKRYDSACNLIILPETLKGSIPGVFVLMERAGGEADREVLLRIRAAHNIHRACRSSHDVRMSKFWKERFSVQRLEGGVQPSSLQSYSTIPRVVCIPKTERHTTRGIFDPAQNSKSKRLQKASSGAS